MGLDRIGSSSSFFRVDARVRPLRCHWCPIRRRRPHWRRCSRYYFIQLWASCMELTGGHVLPTFVHLKNIFEMKCEMKKKVQNFFWGIKCLVHFIACHYCRLIPNQIELNSGLGLQQPSGHLDFYPNGGEWQPGCLDISPFKKKDLSGLEKLTDFFACSHMRAIYLFTDSILADCQSVAYECSDYDSFLNVNNLMIMLFG